MKGGFWKYYYGAWQNLYNIVWPMRFLLECIFVGIILCIVVVIIKVLAKKWELKTRIAKVWCVIVKETVYILGGEKAWAVAIDGRMLDWLDEKLKKAKRKRKKPILKVLLVLLAAGTYFFAVFVDLPVSRYVSEECLAGAKNVKAFFRQIESFFSKGYEVYPPLFVRVEEDKESMESEKETEAVPEDVEPIYIQLNDRGKGGSNIRKEPDLSDKGNIIGGVNEKSEILYGGEWVYDGERYWLRVYVPKDDVEGWLSGQLVEGWQLEEIVKQE